MDLLSSDAKDLTEALAFFTPEERAEFFRWSQVNCEFDGITKRMLYGHPYYIFGLDHAEKELTSSLLHIAPDHRLVIEDYIRKSPLETRILVEQLLFIKVDDAPRRNGPVVLALPLSAIHSFCMNREGAEKLTAAELRTLGQIMSGLDSRNAALDDGVSNETKRTQIKAVNAKLGFKKQIDLVAELISGLLLEIVANSEGKSESTVFDRYFTQYAPRSTRLQKVINNSQQVVRLVDIGPSNGTVVVGIHASLMGIIDERYDDMLHENNLRFIWPVRHGALSEDEVLLPYVDHVDQALEGIEAAIKFSGSEKVTLHAIGASAFLAIEFARRYPVKVQKIVFQGAGRFDTVKLFSSQSILNSIGKLAEKNPLTLNLVFKFMNAKLNHSDAAQNFLAKTYQSSPKDLDNINKEFGSPNFGERFRVYIQNSLNSILHDFRFAKENYWQLAREIDTPLHFLHGTEDGVYPIEEIPNLIAEIGRGDLTPIVGAGNMTSYSHTADIINALSEIAAT